MDQAAEEVVRAAPAWARELLRDARVARLGTADRRGRPHVVPVCFALDDFRIWSAVDDTPKRTTRLRRLANIVENPLITLLVDEWSEEWSRLRWVRVDGRADVLEGGDAERGIALLRDKYPQYRVMGLGERATPLIRITVERLVSWAAV
ncbi:MAG: TIGR03668 family PPOX class F420-dependent oxidoreductase [Candidatus Rokuibacteriota bacterium]